MFYNSTFAYITGCILIVAAILEFFSKKGNYHLWSLILALNGMFMFFHGMRGD